MQALILANGAHGSHRSSRGQDHGSSSVTLRGADLGLYQVVGGGVLRLGEGADRVLEGPHPVDGVGVFHPELYLAVIRPDGGCAGIFSKPSELHEVGRCQVFIYSEFESHAAAKRTVPIKTVIRTILTYPGW